MAEPKKAKCSTGKNSPRSNILMVFVVGQFSSDIHASPCKLVLNSGNLPLLKRDVLF